MRIGIEAQRIFREKKHGMDFVVLEMIKGLQKIDKINQYIIYVNEGPDSGCLQETPNFKISIFEGTYAVWEQVYLRYKVKQDKLDLLHCTSNTAPVWLKIPLIVTIHDIIYFEKNPLFIRNYSAYQKFGNVYRRFVVSAMLSRIKRIITVSNFEKKRIEKHFNLAEGEVQVLYNGVTDYFKPIEDVQELQIIREKYNLPKQFILFLGNTDPKKNTPNTVLAFAEYCKKYGKQYKMVIGDLEPDFVTEILSYKGLEEYFSQIHFTGYIPNEHMPAIINLADVFLYPSKRESFGIPILEGMACGTPILTGNTSSMPEIASDAAYLVDPNSIEEITEGINNLLTNSELREKLKKKGLERVKHFSWEKTAEEALKVYHQIL